jgi:hypothetical protein
MHSTCGTGGRISTSQSRQVGHRGFVRRAFNSSSGLLQITNRAGKFDFQKAQMVVPFTNDFQNQFNGVWVTKA